VKESKVTKRFEEVAAEMRGRRENKLLLRHLGGIRDAVRDLQGGGLDASLAVRPGSFECPVQPGNTERVLANGTVCLDGLKIDFVLQWHTEDYIRLLAIAGSHSAGQEFFNEKTDVRTVFTEMLLKTKAAFSLMEEFNVGGNGQASIATGKDLSVSPPIKLKPKPDLSL
jgi:hypothetical protein